MPLLEAFCESKQFAVANLYEPVNTPVSIVFIALLLHLSVRCSLAGLHSPTALTHCSQITYSLISLFLQDQNSHYHSSNIVVKNTLSYPSLLCFPVEIATSSLSSNYYIHSPLCSTAEAAVKPAEYMHVCVTMMIYLQISICICRAPSPLTSGTTTTIIISAVVISIYLSCSHSRTFTTIERPS